MSKSKREKGIHIRDSAQSWNIKFEYGILEGEDGGTISWADSHLILEYSSVAHKKYLFLYFITITEYRKVDN